MRLSELFEAKGRPRPTLKPGPKPVTVDAPTPRNFVAKNARTHGAGSHTPKGYNRKEKHPKKHVDEANDE